MDDILPAVVMRDSDPVPADWREVLADYFQEVIDSHPELLVILLGFPTFRCRSVLLQGLLEGFFIGYRKRRLLDIEKRADLTVTDRGESLLLLFGKGVVFLTGYGPFLIGTVTELIPTVPHEGYAFLPGLHVVTAFLGFRERDVKIGPESSPVAVKGEGEGIECGNGCPGFRIEEPGSGLALRIEKDAAVGGSVKGLREEFLPAVQCILFNWCSL